MIEAKVGLVTVTYNSAEVIDEFMASVLAQDYAGFVLYVIDNASHDTTLERLAPCRDPRIVLLLNVDNLGVAKGNNQGIERALADGCTHVLLINNDTVFGPDLLSQMLAQMGRLSADMLVPKMMFHRPRDRIWCAGGAFRRSTAYSTIHYGEGDVDCGQHDTERRVEYAPTCCMLIRHDVFARVGLMDEKYFVYYDDTDFCLRALRVGVRMWYCPAPVLYHKVSALTGGSQSAFAIRYGTRNKVYFIRKHLGAVAASGFLVAYYLYSVLKLFAGRDNWAMARLRQRAFFEGLRL